MQIAAPTDAKAQLILRFTFYSSFGKPFSLATAIPCQKPLLVPNTTPNIVRAKECPTTEEGTRWAARPSAPEHAILTPPPVHARQG